MLNEDGGKISISSRHPDKNIKLLIDNIQKCSTEILSILFENLNNKYCNIMTYNM